MVSWSEAGLVKHIVVSDSCSTMSPLLHSEVVNNAEGICGRVVGYYKSDVNKTVAAEEKVCLHAISGRAVTRHPRVSDDDGGSSGNCEITACLYLVVITAAL